ncbi:MAG: OmpA family protein [Acidobacteria bacterium]|nr:OmpA family protein [Acidobacteriota bacterium]
MDIIRKNLSLLVLTGVICLPAASGCSTRTVAEPARAEAPRLQLTADVLAEPEPLLIRFGEEEVGMTPLTLQLNSFNELLLIKPAEHVEEVMETRFRFSGINQVQVIFRRGAEPVPLAQALRLNKVLVFDYSSRATFNVDEYLLKPEMEPLLLNQVEMLIDYFPGVRVYVCGHTDSTGTVPHNLELSLQRARSVRDFLMAHGVVQERLISQGFGADYPIATNSTDDGRALNRRTEVVLPQ